MEYENIRDFCGRPAKRLVKYIIPKGSVMTLLWHCAVRAIHAAPFVLMGLGFGCVLTLMCRMWWG